MIECRYSKISPTMMRATTGYMVVSPSVPSSVRSDGLYGVQLRIADGMGCLSMKICSNVPARKITNALSPCRLQLDMRNMATDQAPLPLPTLLDETFSSFSEHSHLPLKVLLGRPLYLEVQLNSPKPEATLLVNYCVAYTRSATNALVLLYEG